MKSAPTPKTPRLRPASIIACFLLGNLIDFDALAARVLGGPVKVFADGIAANLGGVLISFGGMLLAVGVCWFLHRRKLYLRL